MSILFSGRGHAQISSISWIQRVQMFFVTHFRQAVNSLGDLMRAPAATLMTIGVLGFSITLPSTLYILVKNAEQVSAGFEDAAEISLFMKSDVSESQVKQLMARLNVWPEVAQASHISPEQALQEFTQVSGFEGALAQLDANPLPHVVLVMPTQKHAGPSAAKLLLQKLSKEREVELGKVDIEWLERLFSITGFAKQVVTIIAMLLFFTVVLIIGNTIRLNILNKRDEILVMKLVGATDAFIQRPFMYTGFWYGLLGGVIAWFTVIVLMFWINLSVGSLGQSYQREIHIEGMDFTSAMVMIGVSIALGLIGSIISVQRHVKEIEPK